MLKLIHVQARLKLDKGRASVRQMDANLPEDQLRAEEVIALFRQALTDGLNRDAIALRLSQYSGVRLDYREIDGLAKVIGDSFAAFEPVAGVRGLGTEVGGQGSGVAKQREVAGYQTAVREESTANNKSDKAENESSLSDVGWSLTQFRLNLWREASLPEVYPFRQSGLLEDLKPGVGGLRRVMATHDETLLAGLLPQSTRTALLHRAAQQTGVELRDNVSDRDIIFADLPGRYRLTALSSELNLENLLNRYNIELLRGVLYLAPRLRIVVRDKYKDLFKYIKLFGLMHEVRPIPKKDVPETAPLPEAEIGGYEILLEGAASPFLDRTDRRYGLQFAKFLPALLLCEADWQLETELQIGANPRPGQAAPPGFLYRLGPQPHLRTHFKGSGEFDSLLEESFALAFEQRFKTTTRKPAPPPDPTAPEKPKGRKRKPPANPQARQGWTIQREDRIINVFDTVMIPDFAFEHSDGRRALLEIVGFWELRYLERKIAKLNRAGRSDIIVLVSERTRCGRENFDIKGQAPPYQLIFFKGTPQLGLIMEAIEKCAVTKETVLEEAL